MLAKNLYRFATSSLRHVLTGGVAYWLWVVLLLIGVAVGAHAYSEQFREGFIVTNMRDEVCWGFYIGNFTFLVGIAAAAIVLVIPAYVYDWKPIREIAIIGELLAICAVVMCMLFVMVDVGQPLRVWHMLPLVGTANLPSSVLAWDVLTLSLYLVLNFVIVTHLVYRGFVGKKPSKAFVVPLILFSIPAAVGIQTVEAFVLSGLSARPFWNSAILPARFLASAFCSGPAIILILLQLIRRTWHLEIKNEALWKIAELMAYAMFLNLFLFGAEIFREYYSNTHHLLSYVYSFTGLHGYSAIVGYSWAAVIASVLAFLIFIVPRFRKNMFLLNVGAVLIYVGVYIEKGVALIVPGFNPSTLGGFYEYTPNWLELRVAAGIFSAGFLLFTLMIKVTVPVLLTRKTDALAGPAPAGGERAAAGVLPAATP